MIMISLISFLSSTLTIISRSAYHNALNIFAIFKEKHCYHLEGKKRVQTPRPISLHGCTWYLNGRALEAHKPRLRVRDKLL